MPSLPLYEHRPPLWNPGAFTCVARWFVMTSLPRTERPPP